MVIQQEVYHLLIMIYILIPIGVYLEMKIEYYHTLYLLMIYFIRKWTALYFFLQIVI